MKDCFCEPTVGLMKSFMIAYFIESLYLVSGHFVDQKLFNTPILSKNPQYMKECINTFSGDP